MAERELDEYKPVKFYSENTKLKQSGFSKFQVDDTYFFCRYVDSQVAIISQAYVSKAGRDNGIESVKKNEKIASRYKFIDRDGGLHGFALKAGNGQEIAISADFKTLSAAERAAGRLTGTVKAKSKSKSKAKVPTKTRVAAKPKSSNAKSVTKAAAFTPSDGRVENYKPLAFYETHGGKADGFNSFENDGAYYFNYAENGKVILISESYTAKRGRDNGVASTTKNMRLKSAYEHHVHKTGKHYFDINAKNGQEVATSRWYTSGAAALTAAAVLRGEVAKKTRATNVEQNYMPIAFYKKNTTGQKEGFESFKGEDNEYYFAYFENSKIALISEGYPTATIRDKGLASVQKNMKIDKRYVYGTGADGKHGFALRAGNNKEIARSVAYGSAAAAAAGAAYLLGTRKRTIKANTPAKSKSKQAAEVKTKAVPLAAAATLAGATAAAAKSPSKSSPKAETSEASPAPVVSAASGIVAPAAVAAAAAAIAAPVMATAATPTPTATAEPAAVTTGGGSIWPWLKWLLLLLAFLLAIFILFKACAGGEKITAPAAVAKTTDSAKETVNQNAAELKAAADSKALEVKRAAEIEAAELKAAADRKSADLKAAADAKAAEIKAAAEKLKSQTITTAKAAKSTLNTSTGGKMTAPSVDGRICGPSPNALFNVNNMTPVSVDRLGTNPQFGNSLAYTPREFFQRLQVRYQTNPQDRSFLDLTARSLGYTAFSDMNASMFTNDTLANGTSGLLGMGASHSLQFSTLNVSDPTHLEAFKVRSANGTDVHFMKRCGNYMYVCQP